MSDFIDHGGDINVRGRHGSTAVMEACNDTNPGCLEVLQMLIHAGADLNARSALYGNTALHWCIVRGDMEAMKLLLQGGADNSIKDDHGLTPLDMLKSRSFNIQWWREQNSHDVQRRCEQMACFLESTNSS